MTRLAPRRGTLALALLLVLPLAAGAQTAAQHAAATKADLDSIARDRNAPQYSKRAQLRIRTREDSLAAAPARVDTVRVVDTVYVSAPVDTSSPPDTSTPPVVITPGPPPGGTIFAHPYAPPPNGALLAELPRDTVPIGYPAIARRVSCTALQACLDTARDGDEILLAPGSVSGPITVKVTPRAGWVVVRTAISDAQLGGQWQRMTPARADSLNLATITSSSQTPPVWVNAGAHHVRFTGVRLTWTYTGIGANALWRAVNGETTRAQLAHDLTIDRSVLDGGSTTFRRCVYGDVVRIAVVSSTLTNCHAPAAVGDAQGFFSGQGGPYRIQNNTIQASHQATMFGGTDAASAAMIPQDAYVADNLLERPVEWGSTWGEKTGIEQKDLIRGLYERNVVRHIHAAQQAGFGALIKTEVQGASCVATWTQSADITIRYNRLEDVANGFNLSANAGTCKGQNAARITIYGNVVGPFNAGGSGIPLQLGGPLSDVVVLHNTFASTGSLAVNLAETPATRTVISGNVLPHGAYGVKGASTGEGSASITKFMLNGLFESNVVYPASCSLYPVGTLCSLPSSLPSAWDAKPIGADLSVVP